MPDLDFIKLVGVLKLFIPLAGMMKNLSVPIQSYSDSEPKQIDMGGKIEYVVTVKISYGTKEDALKLIETYNSIDSVLRKLTK